MKVNRDILMTIVKNSNNHLEGEQEILTINEQQLNIISKELTKLFSLHVVGCSLKTETPILKWIDLHNLSYRLRTTLIDIHKTNEKENKKELFIEDLTSFNILTYNNVGKKTWKEFIEKRGF